MLIECADVSKMNKTQRLCFGREGGFGSSRSDDEETNTNNRRLLKLAFVIPSYLANLCFVFLGCQVIHGDIMPRTR